MNNVISIREIRIKIALKEATAALCRARTLISDGKTVPEDLIPCLLNHIVNVLILPPCDDDTCVLDK